MTSSIFWLQPIVFSPHNYCGDHGQHGQSIHTPHGHLIVAPEKLFVIKTLLGSSICSAATFEAFPTEILQLPMTGSSGDWLSLLGTYMPPSTDAIQGIIDIRAGDSPCCLLAYLLPHVFVCAKNDHGCDNAMTSYGSWHQVGAQQVPAPEP